MINKNIIKIRTKLDKIDDKMLFLIKQRNSLVDKILKEKQFKKDIIDKKRINFILNKIKQKSKHKKIDYKITLKIWKAMIWAFIDYEYRNFKKK